MRLSKMTLLAFIVAAGICVGAAAPPAAAQCECGTVATPQGAAQTREFIEAAVYTELKNSSDGRAYVFVVLRPVGRLDPASRAEHRAAVRERQDAVLERLPPGGFSPVYQYENFPVMTGYVDAQGLAQFAVDPDVVAIGPNAQAHATLAESVPFIRADWVQGSYCYAGGGITVAVLDTGIDTNHPDLADDIAVGAYHFLDNGDDYGPGAEDDNGHGTNVAGIITSAGQVAPLGVAPDADILAVKVLGVDGSGYGDDIVAGIDYVVSVQPNYTRLGVINMSLGGGAYQTCPCDNHSSYTQALQLALQAAKDVGIITFASSGNEGLSNGMHAPACLSAATAVAAVYDLNYGPQSWYGLPGDPTAFVCEDLNTYPDLITCFSNRSPCNALAAPGVWITAPAMGGGQAPMSGTSQATPHCSGVAALLLEADPAGQLTPCAIVDILSKMGLPTTDPCGTSPNPRRVDALDSLRVVLGAPIEQALLAAWSDGSAGDWFGYSVAIDGDTLVIGAPQHIHQGKTCGSAYVFRYSQEDDDWFEETELLASDGGLFGGFDEFGHSVAISGDTIVVGAPGHVHLSVLSGAAYVFWYDGSNWVEQAELLPSPFTGYGSFGCSVAIAGNRALVGAPYEDNANGLTAGAVYPFLRSGSNWAPQVKLLAQIGYPYNSDHFGSSVGIQGNWAAIGVPGDNQGVGAVHAYEYVQPQWQWRQQLTAGVGQAYDSFGASLAIASQLVIGAPGDDDNGSSSGSAYTFVFDPYAWWGQRQKLLACDGEANDHFGYSVAISASGNVVIGADGDDDMGPNSGSAYAFRHDDNGTASDPSDDFWCHQAKLRASDGCDSDCFGFSVAMSAYTAVIGAFNHDGGMGPGSGSAYVFAREFFADCNGNGFPDDCDIRNGTSQDCQPNGIPDECDLNPYDPDGNGLISLDCQPNGVPDECDLASGTSQDCNTNSVPDECDIADGTSQDCNTNSVPDECDLAAGTSQDCNSNGMLDECESIMTDITLEYSAFTAKIFELDPPEPMGSGSIHLFTICNGYYPPLGSNEYWSQYDTYHEGDQGDEDWLGYEYDEPKTFNSLLFQEGMHFVDGGWFDELRVQVLVDEDWVDVVGLVSEPPYPGDNGVNFDMFTLSFEEVTGDGIRLYGNPGGEANFIGVAELRVRSGVHPTYDCNSNGVLDECDIADGTSQDANSNGIPDECEAPPVCSGDSNCDGAVNWRDIDFFVAGMNDNVAAWEAMFEPDPPPCSFENNDVNGDGTVSWRDIDSLVALMNTTCP